MKHLNVAALVALSVAITSTSAQAAQGNDAEPPAPPLKRVIVQMKPASSAGGLAMAMASPLAHLASNHSSTEVTAMRRIGVPGLVTAEVTPNGLKSLRDDPQVLRVVEDRLSRPTLLQTVHLVGADASTLPASGLTAGAGQVIAMLDTGITSAHPFLKGKVVDEACFSTKESTLYKLQSMCPNGLDTQVMPGAAAECDAATAGCGHGTHVAGIAVGGPMTVSGKSIRGVAPGARLIAIQVYTRFNDPSVCGTLPVPCALSFASDQIRALEYVLGLAATYKIAAVNMSLGGGAFTERCQDDPLADVVSKLKAKGIAVIASSGNDALVGSIASPACVPGVVPVGAVTKANALALEFSNASQMVALLAPGDQVLSAAGLKDFVQKRGTSMAAPHVSGAWAILRQAAPNARIEDIVRFLQTGGVKVVDPRTGQNTPSIRINVAHAMAKKLPQPPAGVAPLAANSGPGVSGALPTRVIVDVSALPQVLVQNVEELSSKIRQAVGADAVVQVRDSHAIVERPGGISAVAEGRIKEALGAETRVHRDRLSSPK